MEALVNIKISKDKGLALLLFGLLYFFNSQYGIELKFVILFLFATYFFLVNLKVYNSLLNVIFPLFTIFLIAAFSAIFNNPELYDVIRDSVYLLKPVIAIVLGCYLVGSFNDKNWILKAIIYFCFFTAIMHIFTLIYYFEGVWDTARIRTIGGKGSDFEAFVFSFFFVYCRKGDLNLFSRRFKKLFIIIVSISICLYLSRTTFIALIIFLITYYGLTQINRKQIVYLFGVLVVSITFLVSLQFMNIRRESTGIESFLYKIKIAPSEVFNSDVDTSDHSRLWDNWRAFEVRKAFETMEKKDTVLPYFTGMGLGGLVDLGFEAPLGIEKMQYIPHLHNGYAFIFFKSGIIGLLILLVWIFSLYIYIYKKSQSQQQTMYFKVISGIGLYLFFSTLVITGIYNLGVIFSLILGIMLGLTINSKKIVT